MNLEKAGSPLLQERGTYVLMQIISKWGLRRRPVVMLECKKGDTQGLAQPTDFGQDLALTLSSNALS